MRIPGILAAALLTTAAAGVLAQPDDRLTPQQVAIACAIPAGLELPRVGGPRVAGGQDVEARALFGPRDLLVINGGIQAGLQLGQRFFVRRPVTYGMPSTSRPRAVHTAGWIRIVALNATTGIAAVDVACGDIVQGDYLDAFAAPVVPPGMDRADVSGEPDFTSLGRILFGGDEMRTGAAGDFMLIDRGSRQGLMPGSRLAIYRDIRTKDLPLASIGEGIVISTTASTSVMRITLARDAIETGDVVVPRK